MLFLMFTIHNDNIHTMKHMLCWRSNNHFVLEVYTLSKHVVCNFLTIVMLVVHILNRVYKVMFLSICHANGV